MGNFRVEPPGLFRGRGEHPKVCFPLFSVILVFKLKLFLFSFSKMGKLKKRILPEDITINVGREAPVPECPVPGHQ